MMQSEFERLAGYEVNTEDYINIIEPMYMATNVSKQDFVKMINRKAFEKNIEKKLNLKKMLVRDRSGYTMTPNGCYYHIEWVELVDVLVINGKFVVKPIDEQTAKELRRQGKDLDLAYDYDFDYTRCVDTKHRAITLN